ncbi:MAG: ATP-binding protein, partial [Methanosarcinaceae archaeon]|nr:ATP-binding protein [Methanosarcinaceae archaeon]
KTELGIAKEYEIREKLKSRFGFEFKGYLKDNIELDAVGFDKGTYHIVEIKWRNKATSYKDVINFMEKTKVFDPVKLYFISRSGFTKQAESLLNEKNIEVIKV